MAAAQLGWSDLVERLKALGMVLPGCHDHFHLDGEPSVNGRSYGKLFNDKSLKTHVASILTVLCQAYSQWQGPHGEGRTLAFMGILCPTLMTDYTDDTADHVRTALIFLLRDTTRACNKSLCANAVREHNLAELSSVRVQLLVALICCSSPSTDPTDVLFFQCTSRCILGLGTTVKDLHGLYDFQNGQIGRESPSVKDASLVLFGVTICACRYVSANDKEGWSVQSEAEKLICRAEDAYAEIAGGKGRLDILKGVRSLPGLRSSHEESKPSTLTIDLQGITLRGSK